MERRIAPPAELDELLNQLTDNQPGRPYKLFESKQKALTFAATLGYHFGKPEPLNRKGTSIRMDIWQNARDDGFINALAVAETGDLHILEPARSDERARIFEEYAHAGLLKLKHECMDRPGNQLMALMEMIEGGRRAEGDETLEGIDSNILTDLLT